MNWQRTRRFVGDIFGAPLAIEGLLAFFLESTFLGLWIFGWDRLPEGPPRDDLARRDRHDLLRLLHPRRELVDAAPGRLQAQPGTSRAELTDYRGRPHQPDAHPRVRAHDRRPPCSPPAMLVLGVASWRLLRRRRDRAVRAASRASAPGRRSSRAWRRSSPATRRRKIMTKQQPMKMAAAEALYQTKTGAPFSLFTIGTLDGHRARAFSSIAIPYGLSFLADNSTGTGRSRGSTTSRRSTSRSTAPATTCRSSPSPTGPSGS